MTSFVAETLRAPYPVISDANWELFHRYGMGSGFGVPLPGTFIIDSSGIIRWSWAAPFSPIFAPPSPQELLSLLDAMGGGQD
jgi:alkyl hydroperoxide reductase subunit AhpC